MGWLTVVDGFLPVGDLLYLSGILLLGYVVSTEGDIGSLSNEDDKKQPDSPDVTYPGNDPQKAPDGYVWKGKGERGGKEGNYYNPDNKTYLHPDLDHTDPNEEAFEYDPASKTVYQKDN